MYPYIKNESVDEEPLKMFNLMKVKHNETKKLF